jgi:hypothetical protein
MVTFLSSSDSFETASLSDDDFFLKQGKRLAIFID